MMDYLTMVALPYMDTLITMGNTICSVLAMTAIITGLYYWAKIKISYHRICFAVFYGLTILGCVLFLSLLPDRQFGWPSVTPMHNIGWMLWDITTIASVIIAHRITWWLTDKLAGALDYVEKRAIRNANRGLEYTSVPTHFEYREARKAA